MFEVAKGKIMSYQPELRLYEVGTDDGRIISRCRKIGDVIDNVGGRKVSELADDTEVMLLLYFRDAVVNVPEGFILGAYETYGGETLGTRAPKEQFPQGTQGFVKGGRRILLYPDGRVEIKANPWCSIYLDPENNSVKQFFQQMLSQKDPNNYISWGFHPESDDLKNSLLSIGISGENSLGGDFPDIALMAGALWGLQDTGLVDLLGAYGHVIDEGAVLGIRLSSQPGTHMFFQFGKLQDGAVLELTTDKEGEVKTTIKFGEFGDDAQTALIEVGDGQNNVRVETYKDGRCVIRNAVARMEMTGDGSIDAVAADGKAAIHLDKGGPAVITSTEIRVGAQAKEMMVLGNTLEKVLGKMINLIKNHDHNTGVGPSTAASLGLVSQTLFANKLLTPDPATVKSAAHKVE